MNPYNSKQKSSQYAVHALHSVWQTEHVNDYADPMKSIRDSGIWKKKVLYLVYASPTEPDKLVKKQVS